MQGDREEAKKAFLGALRLNVFSYEAFQAFTRFDMLSKDEGECFHIEMFLFLF